MGTKLQPDEFDCYDTLLPDEPFFVLSARDPSAPATLLAWADYRANEIVRGTQPATDIEKVVIARKLAVEMRAWRVARYGAWRTVAELDAEEKEATVNIAAYQDEQNKTNLFRSHEKRGDGTTLSSAIAETTGLYQLIPSSHQSLQNQEKPKE